MENKEIGVPSKTDEVIIEEEKKDDHVYEQQVSSGSMNNEINGHVEQPTSTENPDNTDASNKPKEPRDDIQTATVTEVDKERSSKELGEEGDIITEDNLDAEDGEGLDHSPAAIRKHQLENLNPAHTANIAVLKHDVPEYRKVQPESYLWLSFFVLIFFSRIFGAIALYKSIMVRLLFLEQKYEESERSSRDAKKWNIVGMIFCLVWVILVVVLIKGAGLLEMEPDDLS